MASRSIIREPLQARSREALTRIFAATGELLADKTFDQVSVGEIAKAASVSVGSIYQRFNSKDALLWALYEEYLCEAEAAFEKLSDDGELRPLRDAVAYLIEIISGLFKTRRGVVRSLLFKYREQPADVPERFVARIRAVYEAGAAYLARAANEAPANARIRFAFSLIVTACREEYILEDTRRLMKQKRSQGAFRQMLTDAVLGMLH